MKRTTILTLTALLAAALSLAIACGGTLDLQIETTPAAEATIAALEEEKSRLVTQVAHHESRLGQLAYVHGGDIWVKTLPDGEPRRLTDDGRNRQPRWSPSGEWLAFRKGDGEAWLMQADGTEARPLNDGVAVDAFAWSPTADRLAYVTGNDLRVAAADGAPTVLVGKEGDPLTPAPEDGRRVGEIAWSPEGRWIAYERRARAQEGPPETSVWKVSTEGDEPIRLYPNDQEGQRELMGPMVRGWTGDGHFLLLQDDMRSASLLTDGSPLYALPAAGGSPIRLAQSVLPHDDFVAPAPTDSRVAIVAGAGRATWNEKRIAIAQSPGGEFAYLTAEDLAALSPTWSPDGPRLAYASMAEQANVAGGEPARQALMDRSIRLIDAGSAENRQLTADPGYRDERPLWSADGSHLLFARLNAEDRASLWIAPVEGGEPQQVVEDLTPAPEWFGTYGHIDWGQYFDWWRGDVRSATTTEQPSPPPPATPTPATSEREIVLAAPEEDTTVASPVEVRGRVSVMPFEGNLRGRVYDAQGQVVGEAPIQAQPDTEGDLGGPGAFGGAIPFEVDATCPGYVEVAEISARDGSVVVSETAVVTLTTGTASAPSGEPTKPAPAVILTREGAIAHSLNLLRVQGVDWAHDNANLAEVRFPDGDRGAFVAVGFSGIAQGYQFLYRVEGEEVVLVDFISGPIDWGVWSLRDFERVDLAFPDLFTGEEDGDREVIQVTGAGHAGTGAWLDGYFEIIEITEEGIHVLFSGAHGSINANPGGFERRYTYAYEDLNDDGVKEIIQTGEECQLEPGESGLEKTDCQPVERVFQFDGLTYVQREEGTPPPDLSEIDAQAWTSSSPSGVWVARGLAAFPENDERDLDRYYTRLTVAQLDRSQEWTVVDRWSELALGYTTPQPLQWSSDESHFYFTNRPVPDGCAVFVNGSDLQRVDLSDGSVTEIVPPVGLWLSLSPDERQLAYVGYGDRGLVVRDLSTGRERQTQIEAVQETVDAHIGHIVWSPDGEALVLTVAIDACGPPGERVHTIVRIDAETLSQTTLITEDERLFTSEAWSERGRVSLRDPDGKRWWLDPRTGELTPAD